MNLKDHEVIEFWFEGEKGNVWLGVTDGVQHWEARLMAAGSGYSLLDPDWRGLEAICVG